MTKQYTEDDLEDQDRYVPNEYVGKLESNWYCRAWNAKREKYCKQRAGHDTEHLGVGRCNTHDGRSTVHGNRSQYKEIIRQKNLTPVERYRELPPDLQDLYDQHRSDTEPLNIEGELALARAILQDYVARYDETRQTLEEWREWFKSNIGRPPKIELLPVEHIVSYLKKISDMVHRERKLQMQDAVSVSELIKIMTELGRSVERWVMEPGMSDEEKLKRIKNDWSKVKINSGTN